VKSREIVQVQKDSGAEVQHCIVEIDRGVSFETAKERLDSAKAAGKDAFFVQARSRPFGWPRAGSHGISSNPFALAIGRPDGSASCGKSRFFRLQKPSTGYASQDMHINTVKQKFRVVGQDACRSESGAAEGDGDAADSLQEVESGWDAAYSRFKDHCLHHNCAKLDCGYGKRVQVRHVLTGSLLGVWEQLQRSDLKLVRMQDDDGDRVVGMLVDSGEISEIKEMIEAKHGEVDGTEAEGLLPLLRRWIAFTLTLLSANDCTFHGCWLALMVGCELLCVLQHSQQEQQQTAMRSGPLRTLKTRISSPVSGRTWVCKSRKTSLLLTTVITVITAMASTAIASSLTVTVQMSSR
jgi:hypothetical protein